MGQVGGVGRGRNRKRVLTLLRVQGPLTQAELARLSGLSRSTVSTIVGELQTTDSVSVVEGAGSRRRRRVGRPGSLVALNPRVGAFLGIDVEHEALTVLLADAAHNVLAEARQTLAREHDAASVMRQIARLVDEMAHETGTDRQRIAGAGVGLAGPINHDTGRIHPSSGAKSWRLVDVPNELSRLLKLPVYLDNDANLGALAEMTWGAGRGATEVAYVKADVGVGAGLVVDGRLYRGGAGVAGEIGHLTIDENGPFCRCGNRGCLERFVGVNALLEQMRYRFGEELTFDELLSLAAEGDRVCRRAIADAGRLLGTQIANLCSLFNPSLVIMAGALSRAGDLLLDPLRAAIARGAVPEAAATATVVAAELGERATSLGAVALAMRQAGTLGLEDEVLPGSGNEEMEATAGAAGVGGSARGELGRRAQG
ncbi:MAG TPA: ROK family transcriptional regulator [Actinomycetota bacterium]